MPAWAQRTLARGLDMKTVNNRKGSFEDLLWRVSRNPPGYWTENKYSQYGIYFMKAIRFYLGCNIKIFRINDIEEKNCFFSQMMNSINLNVK